MNQPLQPAAVHAARIVASRLSNNRAEQEDLASTALLGLLEYANRRAIAPEIVLADPHWRVLRCRAIDRVRKQRRHRVRRQRFAAGHNEPRVETAPLRNRIDLDNAMKRATDKLAPGEREVLESVYARGETLADVARRHGWSHPAARRRHAGMLKTLRSSFSPSDEMDSALGSLD